MKYRHQAALAIRERLDQQGAIDPAKVEFKQSSLQDEDLSNYDLVLWAKGEFYSFNESYLLRKFLQEAKPDARLVVKGSITPIVLSDLLNVYKTAILNGRAVIYTKSTTAAGAEESKPVETIQAFTEKVFSLAFSSDGKILAASGLDLESSKRLMKNRIKLWKDRPAGRRIHPLGEHRNYVRGLAFQPRGDLLVATENGNRLSLWDLSSGNAVEQFERNSSWPHALAFSPDGQILYRGMQNGTVIAHSLRDGTDQTFGQPNPDKPVTALALSPDGEILFVASNAGPPQFWNAHGEDGNQPLPVSLEHESAVIVDAAFSPDGSRLVWASLRGIVQINNPKTGKRLHRWSAPAQEKRIRKSAALAYSPDGRRIAFSIGSGAVRLWEADRDQPDPEVFTHGTGEIWAMALAFTPDGKQLASAGSDGNIKFWLLPALSAAGAEEVSVEVAKGMARIDDFLGRIGSDPSVLFDAGIHDLTESFGESPEIEAFEREGVRPLLLVPGRVSVPAAPLDSPAMKLLVEPRYERAIRQQLSFALTAGIVQITADPARARFVVGGREFVRNQKESRLIARDATFLQVDPSTVGSLTQDFLAMVAAYKPGALLVVGTQAEHSDAVVLFQAA